MRDRSEKPADQCSNNEIGRGLVTDSPAEGHAQINKHKYLQGLGNLAGKKIE